ncbi:hypothetical protein E6W36_14060 [Hankyongella ginsenosidimutans]|uniref:Uncharacterized protein n=1 Tax=Hankyongella ginsenosidimutans TaxID=1763828 RepID=A0A4D7C7X1_9SPHN|nr:hypothetical protein [Hankyongella ginsenosidimutans]QCI80225.1 hypothetical protein E6W36_14060 [Hankyongella ginsenosidimutans]
MGDKARQFARFGANGHMAAAVLNDFRIEQGRERGEGAGQPINRHAIFLAAGADIAGKPAQQIVNNTAAQTIFA